MKKETPFTKLLMSYLIELVDCTPVYKEPVEISKKDKKALKSNFKNNLNKNAKTKKENKMKNSKRAR